LPSTDVFVCCDNEETSIFQCLNKSEGPCCRKSAPESAVASEPMSVTPAKHLLPLRIGGFEQQQLTLHINSDIRALLASDSDHLRLQLHRCIPPEHCLYLRMAILDLAINGGVGRGGGGGGKRSAGMKSAASASASPSTPDTAASAAEGSSRLNPACAPFHIHQD
jgi:hypothetical protein